MLTFHERFIKLVIASYQSGSLLTSVFTMLMARDFHSLSFSACYTIVEPGTKQGQSSKSR